MIEKLTIRREQFGAFEKAMWHDLVSRGVQYVGGKYPLQAAGVRREELRAQVDATLRRARHYGFEGDGDLLRYLDLAYGLGPDFDRDGRREWVTRILDERAFSAHTKMDLLTQLAARELGLEAEAALTVYDEADMEPADNTPETPDEEVSIIEDDAEDFVPESEEPEELPEDTIITDDEETMIEAEA